MRIRLRYFGECESLSHLRGEIGAVFESTVALVADELDLADVDVFVTDELWRTGSSMPIQGFSMSAKELVLRVNPTSQVTDTFRREFGAVLAHELHHCKRWRGPGYGTSLREAIISEGLACEYETKFRGALPAYVRVISTEALPTLVKQFSSHLDCTAYNHSLWFDGRENKGCIPYLGYSVGYRLVRNEIEKYGIAPSELCWAPAARFWPSD